MPPASTNFIINSQSLVSPPVVPTNYLSNSSNLQQNKKKMGPGRPKGGIYITLIFSVVLLLI